MPPLHTHGSDLPSGNAEAASPDQTRVARPATPLDALIMEFDRGLRTLFGVHATTTRTSPAEGVTETVTSPAERARIARLMRVNHSGEVAAQALYHGQAWVARQPGTHSALEKAAAEEGDHLVWCAERIHELGGRTSRLNPLWYAGSFTIGMIAGSMSDATSLGFVAETERQVVEHLESHLGELPKDDARTRAIIEQMRVDEAHHGGTAMLAGGVALPAPVRSLMKFTARVMTTSARWL